MKTRFDLLYDLAARLGQADVADAELVFERLRADGYIRFDDHFGYGLVDHADMLAAYERALADRAALSAPTGAPADEEGDTMRAWLFVIDGHVPTQSTAGAP